MVGPVAVPGSHGGLQGIRLGAGVCWLQRVEVGRLDENFYIRRPREKTLEQPTGNLGSNLVVGHA